MVNPALPGKMVKLRRSQIKFASGDSSLNIVRCATFSQGFLNRQIIILLSCLGVQDDVFLQMQSKAKDYAHVTRIYNSLYKRAKEACLGFKKKTGRDKYFEKLADLIKLSLGPSKWFEVIMKEALLTGYELQSDPIFSSILYSMQLSQYLNLKKKARIIVKDSCVLIGVIDDQGILEEGEVFV